MGGCNRRDQLFQHRKTCLGVYWECVINSESNKTKSLTAQKEKSRRKPIKHRVVFCRSKGPSADTCCHQSDSWHVVSSSVFIYWHTWAQHGDPGGGSSRRPLSAQHLLPGGVHRHPALIPACSPSHLPLHPHCGLPVQPQGLGGDL